MKLCTFRGGCGEKRENRRFSRIFIKIVDFGENRRFSQKIVIFDEIRRKASFSEHFDDFVENRGRAQRARGGIQQVCATRPEPRMLLCAARANVVSETRKS